MGKRRRQSNRHGYVVIDKPLGWTSHDVVARVRRIVGEHRVGHAGTLDPGAVGVLPVAVGLATRTVEYLADASKSYRAWVTFGVTTDSADGDGTVTGTHDTSGLAIEDIANALPAFSGSILQRPPMHSAIKVNGKRLYELARAGVELDVDPRPVTIDAIRVLAWNAPELCIDVECSKGTYIRSLARDLGEVVGTGAHLSHLVRTRTGPFSLTDALTLDDLERSLDSHGWEGTAFHPDWVLQGKSMLVLGSDEACDWSNGKSVRLNEPNSFTTIIRAYDASGRWLGVGEFDPGTRAVRPVKVIPAE
jgi:tRNA pseudouridine55 synthase